MSCDFIACHVTDLVEYSGVCALVNGQQVALFYLPMRNPKIYAIDNFDPIGAANVLSRGIIGELRGELVVASPLYKQHFSLTTGRCLEDETVAVRVWPAEISNGLVRVGHPQQSLIESAA
ncbi:MAG: nitrite reductase small subunit NirD [Spongiibacteraceae bacterium]|jgi:nitrite reductase (NADH) small subunit|nr:nitrite reductase small subunit NirD [Spongiibacteraceae bacterium]